MKQFTTIIRRNKFMSHYSFQIFPNCRFIINILLNIHTPPNGSKTSKCASGSSHSLKFRKIITRKNLFYFKLPIKINNRIKSTLKSGKEITCPYASLCGRIARGGEHVSVGQEFVTLDPVIISRNKKQKKCSYELLGCGGKALTGKQISVSYKFLPCSRW